ncbi:MAG: zf-TFIIB domain-containing protein [Acidobacteriota bacterium]
MSGPTKPDGTHWDTAAIRQEREDGWFRAHEAEMIEAARLRRAEAASRLTGVQSATAGRRCPRDGDQMEVDRVEETEVDRCPTCGGIFFDRGELETLLLRHESHRRGFFRRLLGFEKD